MAGATGVACGWCWGEERGGLCTGGSRGCTRPHPGTCGYCPLSAQLTRIPSAQVLVRNCSRFQLPARPPGTPTVPNRRPAYTGRQWLMAIPHPPRRPLTLNMLLVTYLVPMLLAGVSG